MAAEGAWRSFRRRMLAPPTPPEGKERFVDRLSYASRPERPTRRWLFSPRSCGAREAVECWNRITRKTAKRKRNARRVPGVWSGTRAVPPGRWAPR